MTSKSIRVGVIGTGRISDLHLVEYLQNPSTEIVALCDSNGDVARQKARDWGLPDVAATDDWTELLSNEAIDLVEILVPHHLHRPIAMQAMAAGKAVSLQKPMCVTIEDADLLVDATRDAERPFKLFENFLFFPPVMEATRLVNSGAIGEPLSIRIKSNPGKSRTAWTVPREADKWRQDQSKSGGGPLVFDDGHHKFALARHFMGNPEEVHAFVGWTGREDGFRFDAQSMISFRFEGNRIGSLEVVYSPELEVATRHYAQDDRVEITGTSGIIWINCGHGHLPGTPPLAIYRDGKFSEISDVETGWDRSFVLSTRHFIDVVKNGGKPILTAEEGRQVLAFALAAEGSAAQGRPVRVDIGR